MRPRQGLDEASIAPRNLDTRAQVSRTSAASRLIARAISSPWQRRGSLSHHLSALIGPHCRSQVLGGYGYCGEYVVERLWRDSKLLEIGGGTLESHHKNMIREMASFQQMP